MRQIKTKRSVKVLVTLLMVFVMSFGILQNVLACGDCEDIDSSVRLTVNQYDFEALQRRILLVISSQQVFDVFDLFDAQHPVITELQRFFDETNVISISDCMHGVDISVIDNALIEYYIHFSSCIHGNPSIIPAHAEMYIGTFVSPVDTSMFIGESLNADLWRGNCYYSGRLGLTSVTWRHTSQGWQAWAQFGGFLSHQFCRARHSNYIDE